MTELKSRIRVKRGNPADNNNTLPVGTPFYNTANKTFAVSDGVTALKNLDTINIGYDKYITTQAQFDKMISSSTWEGAKSVLLSGRFNITNYLMVPKTVYLIKGTNNTFLNVKNNDGTNPGIWVEQKPLPTYPDTLLENIMVQVDIASEVTSVVGISGFNNVNKCYLYNSKSDGDVIGFKDCGCLINCTAISNSRALSNNVGFYNCDSLIYCLSNKGQYNCNNIIACSFTFGEDPATYITVASEAYNFSKGGTIENSIIPNHDWNKFIKLNVSPYRLKESGNGIMYSGTTGAPGSIIIPKNASQTFIIEVRKVELGSTGIVSSTVVDNYCTKYYSAPITLQNTTAGINLNTDMYQDAYITLSIDDNANCLKIQSNYSGFGSVCISNIYAMPLVDNN